MDRGRGINIAIVASSIVFVIAFGIGFGIGWLSYEQRLSDGKSAQSSAITLPDGTTGAFFVSPAELPVPWRISVEDQKAGNSVFISLASLETSAWVVIRESRDGKPWNILGARLFAAGKTAGEVELLRATVADNIYYAFVYSDNGDREFDVRTDAPVQDLFGENVMDTFRTK